MSTFIETLHPRADNGTFVEKPQSPAEIVLVENYIEAPAVVRALVDSVPQADSLLTEASAAGGAPMTAAEVERMLAVRLPEYPRQALVAGETAYWRGAARRDEAGELMETVGSVEMFRADSLAEMSSMDRELDDTAASLFAEDVFRRLPEDIPQWQFPRIAEAAGAPERFTPGDHTKVAAFHEELTRVYEALPFATRRRADHLYTWALHGPGAHSA